MSAINETNAITANNASNATNAKVSVVIPAYNAEKFIADAIDSVLTQTYPVHEIIVVDDGSTDGTKEIVEKYISEMTNNPPSPNTNVFGFGRAGKAQMTKNGSQYAIRDTQYDTRHTQYAIRYLSQSNSGPAAARNTGIKSATGEFIAFLDADDMWMPDKLDKQMKLFAEFDYGLVYCDMSHEENGRMINKSYLHERKYKQIGSGDMFKGLLRENFVFTPTVVVKKDVLGAVGGFDETLKICEDYKLWLKISRKFYLGFVDEPLVVRRRHGANITSNKLEFAACGAKVFEELLKDSANKENLMIIRSELGRRYFDLGYILYKQNRPGESRIAFARAFMLGYRRGRSLAHIIVSVGK